MNSIQIHLQEKGEDAARKYLARECLTLREAVIGVMAEVGLHPRNLLAYETIAMAAANVCITRDDEETTT